MTTMTETTELFPASVGRLPAVPRNPSQQFDLLCAELRAVLCRLDELTLAIKREEAAPEPNWHRVDALESDRSRLEEQQALIERHRFWAYWAVVSGIVPGSAPNS
jgi:hypothetical protein